MLLNLLLTEFFLLNFEIQYKKGSYSLQTNRRWARKIFSYSKLEILAIT